MLHRTMVVPLSSGEGTRTDARVLYVSFQLRVAENAQLCLLPLPAGKQFGEMGGNSLLKFCSRVG